MQTFFNDPNIKELYLKQLKAHALADEIVQGHYWENGKGCAIGCTIHGSDHARYETALGIPRALAYLEDRIFEGLSNNEAKAFPLQFLTAIPLGADLGLVMAKFMLWLLVDPDNGVIRFAKTKQTHKVIQDVANLYKKLLAGKLVTTAQWNKVRFAADAYDAAAYDAAAADAADAAVYARSNAYRKMRDQLLHLLETA